MGDTAVATPLLTRTQELLRKASAQGLTYLAIYKDTELRPNWLTGIATGSIDDPSVRRVQRLHDYLSRRVGT